MRTLKAVLLANALLLSCTAQAGHTRVANPNALSLELLGRGLLYGIQYDRALNDDMAAGFGFGSVNTDAGQGTTTIPVYMNYYLSRDQGSLFGTVGATVIGSSAAVKGAKTSVGAAELPDSGVLPQIGFGYENRGDIGFLVRFAGYLMIGKKATPWAGATFGYAF